VEDKGREGSMHALCGGLMQILILGILSALGIWCGKDKDKELRYQEQKYSSEEGTKEAAAEKEEA